MLKLLLVCLALWAPLAQAEMRIVVSVDWEGRNLDPVNLEAMQALRKDYPDVPLQHFLNAAYYTKAGADAKAVTQSIRSVLRPGDEEGLHIHAWKRLFEAAGVQFRTEPAFRGALDLSKCSEDCGHDVNLTAYNESELRKVIRFSKQTLQKAGFDEAKSFRAGAWQADRKVLRALAHEGITLDSSATDARYLEARWGKTLLFPVVKKIWPDTKADAQPYRIELGEGLSIVELPNNGNLSDYMTGPQMLEAFRLNASLAKADPKRTVYLSIGFHQETAQKYLPHLREGIDLIRKEAKEQNIPIVFDGKPRLDSL